MTLETDLSSVFAERFGAPAEFVATAPGRVNLIGEHTDYNDGFVLPAALGLRTGLAVRRRSDRTVRVLALDLRREATFDLDAGLAGKADDWSDYLRGVAWALAEARGPEACMGLDVAVSSTVPVGAGLSSSAALELGFARAMVEACGGDWDPVWGARIAQRAEVEFVGVKCGLMDQLASAAGQAGHALLIDCRAQEVTPVSFPESLAVVVLDTGTRRSLQSSAFNARREACERAAAMLGVSALRDIEADDPRIESLPEDLRPLARHVVTENARTLAFAEALAAQDTDAIGRLLAQGHKSLRDDFRVSSESLDQMVALANVDTGCVGARLTGAGFAGCVVALVRREHAQAFAGAVPPRYGSCAAGYVESPADGARIL